MQRIGYLAAGGFGTRLRSVTNDLPKPLVEIHGQPVIDYAIEAMLDAHVTQLYVGLHYKALSIAEHLDHRWGCSLPLEFLFETHPLGTIGAVGEIPDFQGVLVTSNADVFPSPRLDHILAHHDRHDVDCTVGTRLVEERSRFGEVVTDGDKIIDIQEKPLHRRRVLVGSYVLGSKIKAMVGREVALDAPDLLTQGVANGLHVSACDIPGDWIDVGTPQALAEARLSDPPDRAISHVPTSRRRAL